MNWIELIEYGLNIHPDEGAGNGLGLCLCRSAQ